MHGVNSEVIRHVCKWLEEGDRVWFATIIETWGASPRPVGSLFAYNPEKERIAGSLSGGCIEDALLEQLKQSRASLPFRMRYGDSPEEQERFQLPCGGSIEIVIEPLNSSHLTGFLQIAQTLEERKQIVRALDLKTGHFTTHSDLFSGKVRAPEFMLEQVLGPEHRLLIVGAGEICRYLIPLAQNLEFAVTVCDARKASIDRHDLDLSDVDVRHCLPDDLVREQFSDAHCAIVALSHDPRVDDLAVIAGLETDAFYVGAMGSIKTSGNRYARLKQLGLSDESLARLHAPIGLNIRSKTPPEIAIAIAAQLIEQRFCNILN